MFFATQEDVMFFQDTLFPESQPNLPLGQVAENGLCEPAQLIPSVAEEAGLGQFVYMRGVSGKRYVFSAISQEQTVLYENALFAAATKHCAIAELVSNHRELRDDHTRVYVHLLADDDVDNVVADIRPVQ
jgi:hypothetical protein